jgi:hypothetical protein
MDYVPLTTKTIKQSSSEGMANFVATDFNPLKRKRLQIKFQRNDTFCNKFRLRQ